MTNKARGIIISIMALIIIALMICVIQLDKKDDARSNMQHAQVIATPAYTNPTDASTNVPTQAPTDAPTQMPTDAPTQTPTQAPTQAPTEAPTQPPMSSEVPAYVYSLSSKIQTCGYDPLAVKRDEFNRPATVEYLQTLYGDKYNTAFIGPEEKVIYLTFTMGYEYYDENGVANTDKILAILEEKGIRATFFVDNGYIYLRPDLCKKIVDTGNALGGHSYRHPVEGVASWPVNDQIEDAKKIKDKLFKTTGVMPTLYRPDSGIWSEQSLAIVKEMGFKPILYSYSYNDYNPNNQPNPAVALKQLKDNLHHGEILYLHTISATNVQILPEFIDYVHSQGYTFKMFE